MVIPWRARSRRHFDNLLPLINITNGNRGDINLQSVRHVVHILRVVTAINGTRYTDVDCFVKYRSECKECHPKPWLCLELRMAQDKDAKGFARVLLYIVVLTSKHTLPLHVRRATNYTLIFISCVNCVAPSPAIFTGAKYYGLINSALYNLIHFELSL